MTKTFLEIKNSCFTVMLHLNNLKNPMMIIKIMLLMIMMQKNQCKLLLTKIIIQRLMTIVAQALRQ